MQKAELIDYCKTKHIKFIVRWRKEYIVWSIMKHEFPEWSSVHVPRKVMHELTKKSPGPQPNVDTTVIPLESIAIDVDIDGDTLTVFITPDKSVDVTKFEGSHSCSPSWATWFEANKPLVDEFEAFWGRPMTQTDPKTGNVFVHQAIWLHWLATVRPILAVKFNAIIDARFDELMLEKINNINSKHVLELKDLSK